MSEFTSEKQPETRTPTSFGDRVRLCRDLTGLGQQALATKVGVSLTTIQNYEGGQFPKGELAVSLASALGCTLDWLLAGHGPIFDPTRTKTSEFTCESPCDAPLSRVVATEPISSCDVDMIYVPLVEARLSAGTGSFEAGGDDENQRRYGFRSDFLCRKGQVSQMVLMRVVGNSMEPEIHHDDVVLIDQSQRTPAPGALFAVGIMDMVYIKMVDALPGKIILKSSNPEYGPLEVDARGDLVDGIRIIGKAVWLGRELR